MTQYFNAHNPTWRASQCCQWHDSSLSKRYNPGTTTKTYALKSDGKQKVQKKAIENSKKLLDALENYFPLQPLNLRSFRISSDLLPCYTLDFTKEWYDEIMPTLSLVLGKAGEAAKKHQIRLSTHPAQYTVLGSNNSEVVKNSIKDIEYHSLFGQLMNLNPEDFVVNIHLQGLYGGKHNDGINRFANNFQYLSDYSQKCLAVENEDKPNGYDIEHVLNLCTKISTRATLDIHHYACYRMTKTISRLNSSGIKTNYKVRDVEHISVNSPFFKEAVKTWKNCRPLFHVSHPFPEEIEEYWMKPNAHYELLWDEELLSLMFPMLQYSDFDIEAKNKEQATKQFLSFMLEEQQYVGEILGIKEISYD